MGTISPFLRLTLQGFDENDDQWGNILNVSALECLEDSISGTGTVDVTSGNVVLADTEGGPTPETGTSHARWAILNVIGAQGATARTITAPARSKLYLLANNSNGDNVSLIADGGTGITVPSGVAQFLYCDGTDFFAIDAATATQATNATDASNAVALGGVAAANYALKTAAQTFSAGQVVERQTVTQDVSNNITIDCSDGNAFKTTLTATATLLAPTNATDGQQFTLAVKQGGGGPHSLNFTASTFAASSGVAPALSTVANDVDYLAFEYVTSLFNGTDSRWIVSQLRDVSDL